MALAKPLKRKELSVSTSSTFVLPSPPSTATSSSSSSSSAGPFTSLSLASFIPYDFSSSANGEDEIQEPPKRYGKSGNPPRPPNAWICYRSAKVLELKTTSQYPKMPQASISKLIGELWRSESPEVKRKYEKEAAAKKLEHQAKYPDYTFRPMRKEQVRKTSLKRLESSDSARKKTKKDDLPSVLRPGPTTVASGLPTPYSPPTSTRSSSRVSPLPTLSEPPSSATSSSFPSTPLYSPVDYSLPPPLEYPEHIPAPINTAQPLTMFRPVANHLLTPPFDDPPLSQASSPPQSYLSYHPPPPPEHVAPWDCVRATYSSSISFDQNGPHQIEHCSPTFLSSATPND
ncbi:HMG-box domain-containing protein [Sporobolomyces salmoneus]|uniref:HMG-box domain-containing protein n=1 Tax=Sporobolomyces salmoneus TaxID=183962 RepID=UPI0031783123